MTEDALNNRSAFEAVPSCFFRGTGTLCVFCLEGGEEKSENWTGRGGEREQ